MGRRCAVKKQQRIWQIGEVCFPIVIEAFDRLKSAHDLVIIEGAGSPAEVNLRRGDIANMGFATGTLSADVRVVLVGDIDRGGFKARGRASRVHGR